MSTLTREQVIDYLSNIPVTELSSLMHELEDKWGVSASPPAAPMGGAFLTPVQPVVDEQSEFSVTVVGVAADKKLAAIKTIREVVGLGLKEAKELVDNAVTGKPALIKEGLPKAEADDLQKKLADSGCTVQLK